MNHSNPRPNVAISVLEHYYRTTHPDKLKMFLEMIQLGKSLGHQNVYETVPLIANKPLDLVSFYEAVIARGGLKQVALSRGWREIVVQLNLPGDMNPFELQSYYSKYLWQYEKRYFHGFLDPSTTQEVKPMIATMTHVGEAKYYNGTHIPGSGRRLKLHLQKLSDLSVIQRLVLALDSGIPQQMMWALNQLTVLSYGDGKGNGDDFCLAKVPALLDALYRQIDDNTPDRSAKRQRVSQLFNTSPFIGKNHILEGRTLLVLNILRNFAFIAKNEAPIGSHKDLPPLLIELLGSKNHEIVQHCLDILSAVAKHIGSEPDDPTSEDITRMYRRESISSLNSLIHIEDHIQSLVDHATRFLLSNNRSDVLRSCEIIMYLAQNPANEGIFKTVPNKFYHRLTELLSLNTTGLDALGDTAEIEKSENNLWPAPWIDAGSTGSGMGVVYGPQGGVEDLWPNDENLDHEARDAALEALYHLSHYGPGIKLKLAKQRHCLPRIANVLTSRIGRAEASRIAAGAIANISMNRDTIPYFLPIEHDLVLVTSADENVSDLLSNVLADVFGMHSLQQ